MHQNTRTPGTTSTTAAASSTRTPSIPRTPVSYVRRFTAGGVDIDEARSTYEQAYNGTRFTARPGTDPFSFRYAYVGDERMTFRTSTTTGTLSGEVAHLSDYVVAWFRTGTGEIRRLERTRSGIDADPFLLPSQHRFEFSFGPHRQNLIHFDARFLEDVATEFHPGEPLPVFFDHDAHPARDALERWRAALSSATSVLLDVSAAPLLRLNAQLPLARALLSLYPWFSSSMAAALRSPSLARARIAIEFLHHHAHEPITPADAARSAGLHTRSLQQAFQRHLGVSPTAYLRDIRLDRARVALTAGSMETDTVAAVAHEWGFGHLGRFSASYRTRFGERPCDTLRR